MVIGDDAIVETEFTPTSGDDLDLDAEDLAPYDEIEGDDATPGFADAAAAAGAAVPVAAAAGDRARAWRPSRPAR